MRPSHTPPRPRSGFGHPASLFPMQHDKLPVDEIVGTRIPGDRNHSPLPIDAEDRPGQIGDVVVCPSRPMHRCPAPLLPQRSKPRAVHPLRTGQCGRRHWRGPAIGGNQVRLQLQPQRMDVRRPPIVQRQDQIVHLLADGGTAAHPAIGQGLLHHVDVLPHRVGQLRLFLRAPLINARGRCLRCAGHLAQRRWQNWRWLRHRRGWRGEWGALPDRQRHRLRLHLRRSQVDRWRTDRLLPPRAQAADSGHERQGRQRRRQRCNASPGDPLLAVTFGLNEVSVITTPATRATGPVQSSYSGQAPLEHAPSRPSCDAEGRGHASPFLHCTDPRRPMPLPSSRPG